MYSARSATFSMWGQSRLERFFRCGLPEGFVHGIPHSDAAFEAGHEVAHTDLGKLHAGLEIIAF